MKLKINNVSKMPVFTGIGIIKKSRLVRSAEGLDSTIHLEVLSKDCGVVNLEVQCSAKDVTSMNFFMPRLIGQRAYYESGFYVESTSNRKLGQYSSFKMESGQFRGASFP